MLKQPRAQHITHPSTKIALFSLIRSGNTIPLVRHPFPRRLSLPPSLHTSFSFSVYLRRRHSRELCFFLFLSLTPTLLHYRARMMRLAILFLVSLLSRARPFHTAYRVHARTSQREKESRAGKGSMYTGVARVCRSCARACVPLKSLFHARAGVISTSVESKVALLFVARVVYGFFLIFDGCKEILGPFER